MLSRLHSNFCLLLAVAVLMLAGCGESDPAPAASPAKPNPLQAAAAKAKAATEATQKASEPDAGEETVVAAAPAYEPPFPDRVDLFAPPKQGARNARQTTEDTADSVVLMGFANLGEPRALLAINGVVKPLSDGEEAFGVQVISITPPRAVLQRGRSRWTASIE